MKLETIIFDLGNVLWHVDYDGWLARFREYNPDLTESDYGHFLDTFLSSADEGKVTDSEFLAAYRSFLNAKSLSAAEAYGVHISLLNKGPSRAMSLLPELEKKYRLHVISNINPWHKKHIEETCCELSEYFESRIYSCDVGCKKPSALIFEKFRLLTRTDFSRAIFFDDLVENVSAANALGLKSVQVTSEDMLCDYLKTRMI